MKVTFTSVPEQGAEKAPSFFDLFAGRQKIYQARVRGRYRQLKWVLMVLFLTIYYGTPWIRWDRGEGAPDQAVLVDTIGRKFYFFFIELWPQEIYIFTGLLLLAALSLFFATALAGRVWCGYACPQTVWTDLFMIVERFFEGNRNARIKFDKQPWTLSKITRKAGKHATWLFVALCTGGAWVFYFVDAPTLVQQLMALDVPFVSGFWILALTALTYLLAGHAREHVCTYMCPYARFQGAMFGVDTLIVSYDEARGEPRGKKKGDDSLGDCVDCGRCVAVCPTGIDIRQGQQYQCINCALCVDACNEVMDKVGRERGLIRYDTYFNMNARSKGFAERYRLIRPRTILYGTLISLVGLAIIYALFIGRTVVELSVVRDRNPLYVPMADGSIRNNYTLHIVNKTHDTQHMTLRTEGAKGARISVLQESIRRVENAELTLPPADVADFRIYVDVPPTAGLEGTTPLSFILEGGAGDDIYMSTFVSP